MLKQIGGFIAAGLMVVVIFFILASTAAIVVKVVATLIFGFTAFWTFRSALAEKNKRNIEQQNNKRDEPE